MKRILPLLLCCLVILMLVGCNLFSNVKQSIEEKLTETISEETTTEEIESTEETISENAESQFDDNESIELPTIKMSSVADPLNNLLALHSIEITQTSLRPDGTEQSIHVVIDADGNMKITYVLPSISLYELSDVIDPLTVNNSYEVYIIDGKGYSFSEIDPSWTSNLIDDDYATTLSDKMHEFEGFTLWLDLLPNGSLQDAGTESVGGFETNKYMVDGLISEEQVTGTLWYDTETHALVQAELNVPAALSSNPDDPESGVVQISLNAQKAEVAPITLP